MPVIIKPVFLYFSKMYFSDSKTGKSTSNAAHNGPSTAGDQNYKTCTYFSISANCISLILEVVLWSIMDHPVEIRAVGGSQRQWRRQICTNCPIVGDSSQILPDTARLFKIVPRWAPRKRPIHGNYSNCHTVILSDFCNVVKWKNSVASQTKDYGMP